MRVTKTLSWRAPGSLHRVRMCLWGFVVKFIQVSLQAAWRHFFQTSSQNKTSGSTETLPESHLDWAHLVPWVSPGLSHRWGFEQRSSCRHRRGAAEGSCAAALCREFSLCWWDLMRHAYFVQSISEWNKLRLFYKTMHQRQKNVQIICLKI